MAIAQASPVPGYSTGSGHTGGTALVRLGGQSIGERRKRGAESEEPVKPDVDPRFLTDLARHVDVAWERNKRAKLEVEQDMLKSLRQRQRQYEADQWAAINDLGGTDHYDGLTATKCRAAESWILDVLAPASGEPWDFEPTPVPEISPEVRQRFEKEAMQTAVQEALMVQQAGVQLDGGSLMRIVGMTLEKMDEVYEQAAEEEAKERAEKMKLKVADQFREGGYHSEFQALVRDFVTFPAAFMLGPVFRRRRTLKYVEAGGQWIPKVGREIRPEYERVSPFDVYPEADSTGTQDGDLFVRRRVSAKELASFRGVPGYDNEAIDQVLLEYGQGGLREWTVIDQSRSEAEGRSTHAVYESNKIDMLRFWGSVQGQWLIDHSMERGTGLNTDAIEPSESYEIDVIKIGRYIIRAIINPDKLGRRPLNKASYEEIPGAFWGHGVPDLIRHDQDACNSFARSVINNTALSAGPLWERNTDRTPGDDGKLYPLKEFRATEDQMASNTPAVRFYSVPNTTQATMDVWRQFMERADENSGVPAYAHGNEDVGGAGNTASGLSMLMSSSSKLLRMAIYNLDVGIVEQVVSATYNQLMLFSKDQSIKGDLKVVPKGATELLIREQMAMRQAEFANSTNNPIDQMLMGLEGRLNLRKAQAKNLDLDVDSVFPQSLQDIEMSMGGGVDQQPPGQQPRGNTGGGEPGSNMRTMDKGGRPVADYQNPAKTP